MVRQVLHVIETADVGAKAVAEVVAGLGTPLRQRGYALHAVTIGTPGPLLEQLGAAGVPAQALGDHGPAGRAWALARGVRRTGAVLVHRHTGGRRLARSLRLLRVPVVGHVHGLSTEFGDGRPRDIAWGADGVVATSQAVADALGDLGVPVVVAPPSVAVGASAQPRPGPGLRAGAAGRLAPVKGYDVLLRALARTGADVTLQLAGEGAERPRLEALVHELGLEDRVELLGWRDDVRSLARSWDVFVQPSHDEGFGLAALEAMAEGVPVLGSRVPGLVEVVGDGGWFVSPLDTDALAAELDRLSTVPDERRATAGRAHDRATAWEEGAPRAAAAVADLYDDLLG